MFVSPLFPITVTYKQEVLESEDAFCCGSEQPPPTEFKVKDNERTMFKTREETKRIDQIERWSF